MIFPARLDRRLHPITLSAQWIILCSLPLSLVFAAAYKKSDGGGEERLNDGGVEVHQH